MARPKGGNILEDSVHLGIRVSGATNDGLERIANSKGVSKSQVAREVLETFVRASDKGKVRR
jgi:hypothetical protein